MNKTSQPSGASQVKVCGIRKVAWDLGSLILLNMVLRTLWLIYVHPQPTSDFDWYYIHASMLAKGQGYMANGVPTAYWPMGYPFFLSFVFRLFGPSVIAGLVANAVLSVSIVCLVYGLGRLLFAHRGVALTAGVLYTLLPSQIMWNSVLGSEELFTAGVMLSFVLYVKWAHNNKFGLLMAGVIMGLACIVRPLPLLFPVFLLLYERFVIRSSWRTSFRTVLLFTVGLLLGVCPATIRNAIAMHQFILVSTNGGVNLWQGVNVNHGYWWPFDSNANPLAARGMDEVVRDHMGKQMAFWMYFHHPILTLLNGFQKWFALYQDESSVFGFTIRLISMRAATAVFWGWFSNICYWLWMGFAILGIGSLTRKHSDWRKPARLPLLFILYYTLVFFFFPAWDRFRYPLMPLFALFMGAGATVLIRTLGTLVYGKPSNQNHTKAL